MVWGAMMGRFGMVLMALLMVFCAGWLAGADYPPPHVRDISAAAWLVAFLVSIIMAAMATSGGQHR